MLRVKYFASSFPAPKHAASRQSTPAGGLELTWDNISPFFTGACSGAANYVNDISR
ncbi:MAG: hypothetical protein HY865_18010 [Chloroflexi bacterium]|nr:hypothetical protein [Chloroflexota bacterium]